MAVGKSKRGAARGKAKLFHKIKDVCELTSTEPYVLRYWEQEFPFLAPEKNKAGHRIYTDEDIDLVRRIKKLLYEEGYTTAGARRQLEKERAEGEPPVRTAEEPSDPGEPAVDGEELERLRGEKAELEERVAQLEGDRGRLLEALQALRADARELRELVAGATGARTAGRPASGAAEKVGGRASGGRTAKKASGSTRSTSSKKKPTGKKSSGGGKKRTSRKR